MEYHPDWLGRPIKTSPLSAEELLERADNAIQGLRSDVAEYLLLNELIWGWTPVTSPYHLSVLTQAIQLITPGAKYWLREASKNSPDRMLAFLRMSERDQLIEIADVMIGLQHQQHFANVKNWIESERKEATAAKSTGGGSTSSDWTTGTQDTSYISHAAASGGGGCSHGSSSSDSGSPCSFD